MGIIIAVVALIVFYALYYKNTNLQQSCDAFLTTTRLMEDVASTNIRAEQQLCEARAKYINQMDMTMQEAIDYIRWIRIENNSYQIIRLDTLEGVNAEYKNVSYAGTDVINPDKLSDSNSDDIVVHMTEGYINPADGQPVMSFCAKINLLDENGNKEEAVLLKVMHISDLSEKLVLSEYSDDASLIMLDKDGNCVIGVDETGETSFFDYLKASSSRDIDTDALAAEMSQNTDGSFFGYDNAGNKLYYTYSHLRVNEDCVVVGCIPTASFRNAQTDWSIPIILIIGLGILMLVNISYYRKIINTKFEVDRVLKEQLAIIDTISREYSNIWLIDEDKEDIRIYRKPKDSANPMEVMEFPDGSNYYEVFGKYIDLFVDDEDKEEMRDTMLNKELFSQIRGDEVLSIRYRKTVDGATRYLQMCFAKPAGDIVEKKIVLAVRDIDEMVRNELQQKNMLVDALEHADAANKAKTKFLSSMSHDIRTPMNGIIGMTAIAGTHIDNPERIADCLKKITMSSKHLLGIINEVLDMSKIESGKLDMMEEDFNIADLIDSLIQMNKPTLESHHHELVVNVTNVLHERVVGDAQHIQQVFMNLLSNAIKYTPDGGKITLTIEEKAVSKKIAFYEVVFRDNGIGMSEEFVNKIFEPFTREENGALPNVQGTGLGMTIVRNIVYMLGGDIKIESKPNEGTKITVNLALQLQNEEEVSYEEFVDLPVLVADDDRIGCESACGILDELGMKSEGVFSGREAVDRLTEQHEAGDDFFAVILDWKMPDMDGITTAKEIRRVLGDDVPIIIISAFDWSDIEIEARRAGVNAFISKPLFKSRIIHLFDELVSGKVNLDEHKTVDLKSFDELDLKGKRVLLAEDNDLNAEIATEILSMTGIEVERAVNGSEAAERVSESEEGYYDIIFMDIQMPIMNGYDATRAIRALNRDDVKKLPIIAMTANAFTEDIQAARAAGMNEHVAKPLDLDALSKVLSKWLVSPESGEEK
jgi:signal transduction histidine kinase/CheY-like chemotaxis protein